MEIADRETTKLGDRATPRPRMLRVADVALLDRLRDSEASSQEIRAGVAGAPQKPPTLSRWLYRIEREGLIAGRYLITRSGPRPGRYRLWSLTEAGTQALNEALAGLPEAMRNGPEAIPTAPEPTTAATRNPAAVEEYIKAGKDTLLWLRKCLVAPPAANRRVIIDRAIKRCHAALAALGELPVEED